VRYSLEQCDAWMTSDMRKAVTKVDACVPGLPPEVLAAFSDAVFNLGPTIACDAKRSTAARFLQAGLLREACRELPRWDKARVLGVLVPLPGLTTRRERERDLCLQGAGS
jgi:GH24 family phage-related lysozyme (muramidase)